MLCVKLLCWFGFTQHFVSLSRNKESTIVRSTSESTDILLAQRLLPLSQKFSEDKANLRKHYHEIIFTTLEKCIGTSRDKQLKLLKEQHDSQVGGATKSIHAQVSREFKSLNKRHKDKDELDRLAAVLNRARVHQFITNAGHYYHLFVCLFVCVCVE